MEQDDAAREGQQRPIAHEHAKSEIGLFGRARRRAAMRARWIDLMFADVPEGEQSRQPERKGHDEDGVARPVSDDAHGGGGDPVADRGKTGIASEPLAERTIPHEPEADGGDGRAEHRACHRMQQLRSHDRNEYRPRRNRKGAHADADDGDRRHQTLGAGGVDERAARHLAGQGYEPADREGEADIDLRPFLLGQVDRDERPESGLRVGEKEDEPVEAAPARDGRRRARGWMVRRVRRCLAIRPAASVHDASSRCRWICRIPRISPTPPLTRSRYPGSALPGNLSAVRRLVCFIAGTTRDSAFPPQATM